MEERKQVLIFTGKEISGQNIKEIYQLRITGTPIFQASYDGSDRNSFYKHIAKTFLELAPPKYSPFEFEIINGRKTNLLTSSIENIFELEDKYVVQLANHLEYHLTNRRLASMKRSQN